MVQVAFSQRRKILRHTLEPWLEAKGFKGTFDFQRRAQEISVEEYIRGGSRFGRSGHLMGHAFKNQKPQFFRLWLFLINACKALRRFF
jgi:hypothetical protein